MGRVRNNNTTVIINDIILWCDATISDMTAILLRYACASFGDQLSRVIVLLFIMYTRDLTWRRRPIIYYTQSDRTRRRRYSELVTRSCTATDVGRGPRNGCFCGARTWCLTQCCSRPPSWCPTGPRTEAAGVRVTRVVRLFLVVVHGQVVP